MPYRDFAAIRPGQTLSYTTAARNNTVIRLYRHRVTGRVARRGYNSFANPREAC